MKKIGFFFFLTFYCTSIFTQNLVPNPSFEENFICNYASPNYGLLIDPWITPTGSADYFHVCNDWLWQVPCNYSGFQIPLEGDCYGGFITYAEEVFNYREYIETPLAITLSVDSVYLIGFSISLADLSRVSSNQQIEVLMSDTLVAGAYINATIIPYDSIAVILNYEPTLTSAPDLITNDTVNWQKFEWIYQAKGSEKFMTIGNFQTDDEITVYEVKDSIISSCGLNIHLKVTYVYIDQVSVEKVSIADVSIQGNNYLVCSTQISDTLRVTNFFDSVVWNTGDTTRNILITAPGLYWVEGYKGFSTWRDTIEVVFLDTTALSLGLDTAICVNAFPYTLVAPQNMDTYTWNDGSINNSVSIQNSGVYAISCTHVCGTWFDTIQITTIADLPNFGSDIVLCNASNIDITLLAPENYATYFWNDGSNGNMLQVQTSGLYWLSATNICGTFADSIIVENLLPLSLDLGSDLQSCLDIPIVLNAQAGFDDYTWSTGENNNQIVLTNYGLYSVVASNPCQTLYDTIEVLAAPAFEIQLPNDTVLYLGDVLQIVPTLNSQEPFSLLWNTSAYLSCYDCFSPTAAPTVSSQYLVEAQNSLQCLSTDTLNIEVLNAERVFIPNVFSPNNDAVNDIFEVYTGPEVQEIIGFVIYDRWGGLIYDMQSNNQLAQWDGSFRGAPLDMNVFSYIIEVRFINLQTKTYVGTVTLVR